MKKVLLTAVAATGLMAMPALGQVINEAYDWEDGNTVIGSYTSGNMNLFWENSLEQAHAGTSSLKLWEDPITGTPQAYVAYVENLQTGDSITCGFWVYDENDEPSYPKGRIWAHYADSNDDDDCLIDTYRGSASGNNAYSIGPGWSYIEWNWIFDAGDPIRDGFVVEARLYSDIDLNTIYIDDMTIEVNAAGGTATVTHPGNYPCDQPGHYVLEVTDLIGGQAGYFLVTGATPSTKQYLVYSLRGTGDTYVPQLDVTLDLLRPTLGASGNSDAAGEILWSLPVPNAASGRTAWVQACEFQNKTNYVEEFID
ncbi:MAG: hypothetical protein D8M59_04190 [Planctomycetes bacterium]|nr:hypothetical protein [Planctomycetota bacterium]